MRWDIFCKVIDNHGDAGVCWRLARGLATAGDAVRLWIDDPSMLDWMAPAGHPSVRVVDWTPALARREASDGAPPDVLIEAFGCHPAPELIERFVQPAPAGAPRRVWLNLEYLSAEPYVERLHGLPSPVLQGPGAGLTKYFFYPGFTDATGGLLREPDLMARRAGFERAAWLARQGIPWRGERLVCLFCYEPAALDALLARFEQAGTPTRLLVTAGRATRALPQGPAQRGSLSITWLPYLPQDEFDHLLWACDLNFVRGEDSLVRAIWAGAPFVWQIYPQDDDAHHEKLEAFLDWLDAPSELRRMHHLWNGMADGDLPPLDAQALAPCGSAVTAARERLLAEDSLVTRLRQFVAQKS
ncbi:elongation factor P maturation arginine rhamnosyltransferase EarP [Variovorax sp. KK3]|uniref:elongation factor P maturation arginine rhamnosyltransferase EarP n=1 Tax=Variovorax sp. KK3 TaxID=1855728 RepID=UPI00097C3D38|nr:elongation factor P maturation arginine rhamnosyltransferase EarP [Variovorax sp. KK3]